MLLLFLCERQISWQHTDSHELQFYSISTDGRVTLWSVSKNELSFQVGVPFMLMCLSVSILGNCREMQYL